MIHDRRVVPFKLWHHRFISDTFEPGASEILVGQLKSLENSDSWTAVVDGVPVACLGTHELWPGRYQGWGYIGMKAHRHMKWITLECIRHLSGKKGRVEFTVRADFDCGLRWAQRLGFIVETPLMKNYGPFGEDHVGFVRIT